ncbi:transposase [Vibrio sp. ArtGut-C1]|uniref:transposase n=1 Tax=Vibrio sp. ArtGut-C1 TaxID=2259137 RepID=UPI00352A4C6A
MSDVLWKKFSHYSPSTRLTILSVRIENHDAMNGILFVLRTSCQWNALNVTGIFTSSSVHRRFQESRDAVVFERFWQNSLIF